ncbi:molybdenum cofactor guanylyltransferase [Maricaulis sp.]|uniref:molybdenum cofactor guanylyltransferase n=1 Tax=Maricaulis sp. TaxID=1486257 RepID=UPI003A8FE85C
MTRPVESGRLAGLILAGGRSERMGQDKAELAWRGQTLLARARALLLATGITAIHVGGRPQEADGLPDSQPHAGPARAIIDAACLLHERYDSLLVIPVDMPLLEPRQLAPLLAGPSGQALHWAGQPLPALVPIAPCRALRDEDIHSIKRLLASLRAEALPLTGPIAAFSNINTPDALARLNTED